jgi:hypothetical protein
VRVTTSLYFVKGKDYGGFQKAHKNDIHVYILTYHSNRADANRGVNSNPLGDSQWIICYLPNLPDQVGALPDRSQF